MFCFEILTDPEIKLKLRAEILTFLFSRISGHRPVQRKCALPHAKRHPYPIPQPVKVGYTTGVYHLFSNGDVGSFTSPKTNQRKCCETGPTVLSPYPRRLESLTICRFHYKGSTSSQLFKDPECWSRSADRRSPN